MIEFDYSNCTESDIREVEECIVRLREGKSQGCPDCRDDCDCFNSEIVMTSWGYVDVYPEHTLSEESF